MPEKIDEEVVNTDDEKEDWKIFDQYEIDKRKAVAILLESLSDSQIEAIGMVAKDPVQIWQNLHEKYARQSEARRSSARRDFHSFRHFEYEIAEETIDRFDKVVDVC